MSSLADYLAKNYLNKDPELSGKKKKKRRKLDDGGSKGKKKSKEGGIIIADDDAMGWDEDGDGEGAGSEDDAVVVHNSTFRKSKTQNWITTSKGADDHGASEASTILAQAAAETRARAREDNGGITPPRSPPPQPETTLESGAVAGLQTASQVAASLAKKRAQDLKDLHATTATAQTHETIYRDASGRILNLAILRREAASAAAAALAAEKAAAEKMKGTVQLLETQERKREIEEAKFEGLARFKDDVKLNEELKEQERWNDPAAQFLTKKKDGRSKTGKPLYTGPGVMPNRYGIRPGHRWDGVDRSNGFEKKWFAARSRVQASKEMEWAWQMDE